MLKGVHLTVMIGPLVPIPAPKEVIDAIESIKVTSDRDHSGFQITFGVSKKSNLLKTLVPAGYFDPMTTRVVLVVTIGGTPNVIMDGIVTRQELSPSNEPGQSKLTITGEDLGVLMDIIQITEGRYPNMIEVSQVYVILAKYLYLGIVPLAIPPLIPNVTILADEIPTQWGTDRAYIRWMAEKAGYVFYIEPGPLPGQSIAYFGPDIRLPVPQPALSINMDAQTNVETMTFSLNGLAKELVIATILDPVTEKIPIPVIVPPINPLRPPLGAKIALPSKVRTEDMTNLRAPAAAQKIVGMVFGQNDSITVSGTLDVVRYGHVLRSRMLVGVRGGGIAYDGLYYVNSVTHEIKRGEYKQSFELGRDGLISIAPKVAV